MRGIQTTPHGYRAFVRVKGFPLKSKRFPRDARPDDMQLWRERERAKLILRRAGPKLAPVEGAFRDNALVYLESVRAMPSYPDRVRDIFHWIVLFDQQECDTITPVQIRAQRDQWLTVGPRVRQKGKKKIVERKPLAASTVNHRLRALQNMWTVLWPGQPNPVKQVPEADEPTTVPRAMPPADVAAIFEKLPLDSKSRARLRVMFTTGLPGKTIMRLKKADVDLGAGIIYLPGRKKGQGTRGAVLPLLPEAIEAFTELDAVRGWGEFSKSGLRSVFLRACKAAKVSGVTVYQLRHTFATDFLAATGDLRATQKALNHSTATLTERYALAAVQPALLDAYAKMAKVDRAVTTKVTTGQKRP